MKRACYYFILTAWILFSFSCHKKSPEKISFYYWKQANEYDSNTSVRMQQLGVSKFYVHLMDVVWNPETHKAIPATNSQLNLENPVCNLEIVPVIYINNNVLTSIDSSGLEALAHHIYQASSGFLTKIKNQQSLREIQIDCDWASKTKDKYFLLLSTIKKINSDVKIGVTIRLYPYKYPSLMGVPPVDYGVLMCYNMDNIKSVNTENSIISYKILQQYLNAKKYPIPLKPALPVFGWYVWFSNGYYKNIIYNQPGMTASNSFMLLHNNLFRVLTDTVIAGNYIRKGDLLRNEFPDEKILQQSASLILSKLAENDEFIFYYWDEQNIPYYEKAIQHISHTLP